MKVDMSFFRSPDPGAEPPPLVGLSCRAAHEHIPQGAYGAIGALSPYLRSPLIPHSRDDGPHATVYSLGWPPAFEAPGHVAPGIAPPLPRGPHAHSHVRKPLAKYTRDRLD